VSAEDLELAREFLDVLATAARTGDRTALYSFLAEDVEWLTPTRGVHGVEAARDELTWIKPPDNLDLEFNEPELNDLGGGRVVSDVLEVYRVKGTGEFAYARDRRIELTIRDGKVAHYEMRIVG
jgi:ketosteroid isomerase-like protein